MKLILSGFWDVVVNTFTNIFSTIGQSLRDNWIMAIITFAILLGLIIYRVLKNHYSVESRTIKAVNQINDYLAKNPFITEDNLVEFNRIMMKAPKNIRFQWQRYVINRDKKPSDFLSEENCITKPIRTKSFKAGIKNFKISLLLLCFFSALFLVSSYYVGSTDTIKIGYMIVSLVTPTLAFFVGYMYVLFSNIMYNAIMTDLFYSFANFQKALDRAVINLPEAIDYEMIFTSKEIQNNIPALQEFLEQRARYDEEQLRKAQESDVEHESYDFEALGVDGSLVMQRALKESETYLGNRRRLLADIDNIQTDRATVIKEFDEENKNYQRSLRDIREEIARLKAKIETATTEITRSSLRRQQSQEVEKEQNIEKEVEKATNKYNKKLEELNAKIEEKRKEIEDSKIIAEQSLTDEFKHFSDKAFKDLKQIADKEVEEKIQNLENEKNDLALSLEEKDKLMAEKLALYEDKANGYDNLNAEVKENRISIDELKNEISNLNLELEAKNEEIFAVKQELESRKREIIKKDGMIENFKKKKAVEIYRYFDANGTEFYFDDNNQAYYLDEFGNAIYYDQPNDENYVDEYIENNNAEIDEAFNEQNPELNDNNNDYMGEELNENAENVEENENKENTILNQLEEDEEALNGLSGDEVNQSVENLNGESSISSQDGNQQGKENTKKSRKKRTTKKKKEDKNSQTEEDVEESVDNNFEIENANENDENQDENFESEVEVQDEGYKGIQDTLNKLAKAAEEKLKENQQKNQNSKAKSKKSKK